MLNKILDGVDRALAYKLMLAHIIIIAVSNYIVQFKFDFFVHGSDWKTNVQSDQRKKLKKIMKNWGGKVIDIPYTAKISSSKIKKLLK